MVVRTETTAHGAALHGGELGPQPRGETVEERRCPHPGVAGRAPFGWYRLEEMDESRDGAYVYWIGGAIVAVLAVLYFGHLGILFLGATEGDVPSVSSIPLPEGSEIVGENVTCGSGGCSLEASVRPPDGVTREELEEALGTTPQARVPRTFWDPRTISLTSEADGPLLLVRADYFSAEYVP